VDISEVKLVASDLDGTLLSPSATVSERTIRVLEALSNQGVEIVAATGRSHWSAANVLSPLNCIRWLICSNGATIYDTEAGEVVRRCPLYRHQLSDIVQRLAESFPNVGFGWESSYGLHHDQKWFENRSLTDSRFVADNQQPTEEFDPDNDDTTKLMLAHDKLTSFQWLDAIEPCLPQGLSVSTSGSSFVEITQHDANKGQSLSLLCDQLGIDQRHTVGFGDHANDMTMLRWVGHSYAMSNASPHVRELADHIAPHHGDDGVAQILERLL